MTIHKSTDTGLRTLLELDGEVFPMDNGYWTKFEVKNVEANKHIPHGIKYSLTLHDRNSRRVLGFDNAHGTKPKKKKFGAKRVEWDHKHKMNRVSTYEFENAGQLLKDFWNGVDEMMNNS